MKRFGRDAVFFQFTPVFLLLIQKPINSRVAITAATSAAICILLDNPPYRIRTRANGIHGNGMSRPAFSSEV